MTKDEKKAARQKLDDEFNNSTTMRPETYAARIEEISRAPLDPDPPKPAAPTPREPQSLRLERLLPQEMKDHFAKMPRFAGLEDEWITLRFLVGFVSSFNDEALEATAEQIRSLKKRLAALEERPALSYRGVWESGIQSERGHFYTHNGAVWYCREDTNKPPGESSQWQLAVKSGRDGRDSR